MSLPDNIQSVLNSQEKQLCSAVIEAGSKIMEYWQPKDGGENLQQQSSEIGIEEKKDGSFVTKADFAANEILVNALTVIYPDAVICSEETGFNVKDFDPQTDSRLVWYVDPLDGTANFINGDDDFLVLLGCCHKGRPVAGIAYFPVQKEFIFTALGRGAHSSTFGQLKVVKDDNTNPGSINIRGMGLEEKGYISKYHTGAAQQLIAQGKLQACAYKLNTRSAPKPWDFAAFDLVIHESGGKVTDGKNKIITYNGMTFSADFYVASNGSEIVHKEVLDEINAA